MNLLKPIKSLIMHLTQSSFQDRVVSFLATKLETSTPCLLITDECMEEVYAHVMEKLRCPDGGLLVHQQADIPVGTTEVVIVHSLFDLDLVRCVADLPSVTRIVYIALDCDYNGRDIRRLKTLDSGDNSVTLVLAYEEKGMVTTLPRNHNLSEVYARLVNQSRGPQCP